MDKKTFVAFLNDVLAIDPAFARSVMMTRHPCNKTVADHPHIQVGLAAVSQFETSPLGLLNGYFQSEEEDGLFIAAVIETDSAGEFVVRRFSLTTIDGNP